MSPAPCLLPPGYSRLWLLVVLAAHQNRPGPLSPFQAGKELLHSNPYAQEDIEDRLQSLNHKWEELNHKMTEQGDRLSQTRQQDGLLELLQVPGECGVVTGTQGGRWDLAGAG